MSELKPCPFCGGEATLIHDGGSYCVICDANDCVGYVETEFFYTEAEAIAAWNTRAEMSYEDALILLNELGLSERTCHIVEYDEAPFLVCSECGAVQPDDFTVYYCWNCGAKVVGE